MAINKVSYYHNQYQENQSKFGLIQQHSTGAVFIGLGIAFIIIVYRLANNLNVNWYHSLLFVAAVYIGYEVGIIRAKATPIEIAFSGDAFYIQTDHSKVYDKEYKWYPLNYASAQLTPKGIELNYINRIYVLKNEEWNNLPIIWQHLNYNQTNSNINYT